MEQLRFCGAFRRGVEGGLLREDGGDGCFVLVEDLDGSGCLLLGGKASSPDLGLKMWARPWKPEREGAVEGVGAESAVGVLGVAWWRVGVRGG